MHFKGSRHLSVGRPNVFNNKYSLLILVFHLIIGLNLRSEIILEHSPVEGTYKRMDPITKEIVFEEDPFYKLPFDLKIKEVPDHLRVKALEARPPLTEWDKLDPSYWDKEIGKAVYMEGNGQFKNGYEFNYFILLWADEARLEVIDYGIIDHGAKTYVEKQRRWVYVAEDGTESYAPFEGGKQLIETSLRGIEYIASIPSLLLDSKKNIRNDSNAFTGWTFGLLLIAEIKEIVYVHRGNRDIRIYTCTVDKKVSLKFR